jgi:endo-1,4-beta-xylanase
MMTDELHHSEMSRRDSLALFGATALLAVTDTALAKGKDDGLNAIAARKGLRIGSAVGWSAAGADRGSFANPAYARLLERDCGVLVSENEMKWQALRPSPDKFEFSHFDAIVDYAKAKGLAMRGHTLLWHRARWMPAWLNNHDFGNRPASTAEQLLVTHIRTVMQRYGSAILSYDVVNESVEPKDGSIIDTSLSKAMGSAIATLDLAFHTARAESPKAELVYNDYMSWEPGNEQHRLGVLKLLEGFRKRGTPVDTLGIQSHIEMHSIDPKTGLGPYQRREWRQFLDEAVAMGYRLKITELDVKDNALPAAHKSRDERTAHYLRAYMEVMLDYPQLNEILYWGMCDKYSWLQGFSPRQDKLPVRCCPYDEAFRPKVMHGEMARLLSKAKARG